MKIYELFDPEKVSWKWDYNSDREAEATFVVGEIQYKFYAYQELGNEQSGSWEVEFKVVEGGDPSNRFGVTGTGNAAQVMSTVVAILREFLQKYKGKINQLTFSAKETSRRDLYARMVRRLLPTWNFEHFQSEFSLTAPKGQS